MTVKLNRKQVLAISKLDFTGLGHSQRLDLIAKALGMRNQATMMSVLNTQKTAGPVANIQVFEPASESPNADADSLISALMAGRLGPTLSERLHLFVARTTVDQEAFALRLASRMLAETYSAPTVMIIRDEESARRAARLSEHGPVFGCMHGRDAKSGILRLRAFGVDTEENPVLGTVSVLGDAPAEPGYVSIYTFPMYMSAEDKVLSSTMSDEERWKAFHEAFSAKAKMVIGGIFDEAHKIRSGVPVASGPVGSGKSRAFSDLIRKQGG